MRSRSVLAAMTLLLVVGALPAFAAAPIGAFDGKRGGGNAARGLMPVIGWALDDNGVVAVDLLVDDLVNVRSVYGLNRPDVTRKHPGFPNTAAPGFAAYIDTTRFLNGYHMVSARVITGSGEVVQVGVARRFLFSNAESILAPFGGLWFPQPDADMFGQCDFSLTRRYSVISGWALDAASGENSHNFGVAWVELLIDGALWLNTRTDCVNDLSKGGLTNCYGLQTPGLTYLYPTLRNSDRGRFRFVLDVGALMATIPGTNPPSSLYNRGHHLITIRAGDSGDNTRIIASINTLWSCTGDVPNEESLGQLEQPNLDQPFAGVVHAKGWALDKDGVVAVYVRVNGQLVGFATLGISRPDVLDLHPSYPTSNNAGWTLDIDSTKLPEGHSTFEVVVRDTGGAETLIGEGTVFVDNIAGQ